MGSKNTAFSSHFLANTLHEVRTPVQTIMGTLELLEETPLNQEQKEYIRQLHFSSEVLLSLANDILDFSKMESGKLKIEKIPFAVTEMTEKVIDLLCIEAFNKGIELITDIDYTIPQIIMGDPTRVEQVLLNLAKNAVKFTEKGFVRIKLESRKNNSLLLFQVQDSGIGISDSQKENLFKDFEQADSSTARKYGGTGLGLAICKNLISLMGGTIGVKDTKEGGALFWFTIPLIKPPIQEQRLLSCLEYPPIPPKTKILIVDDQPYAHHALENKLRLLGANDIHHATSGKNALKKLAKAAIQADLFDIAFIDMIMPEMDGWRLASKISENKYINSTKLCLLIPEGQLKSDTKMKMLNWFNGYIYKPIKLKKLENSLHNYFNVPLDLETISSEAIKKGKSDLPALPQSQKKSVVLIAEDHPLNQKLMATFLVRLNAKVYTAASGKEAIEQIQRHPSIKIIFMDIQMPIMNGIEATDRLRTSGYEGIIIACTANNEESYFNKYLQSGMNDVLVKPFKKKDVEKILAKWQQVSLAIPKSIKKKEDNSFWNTKDMLDTLAHDTELAIELTDDFIVQTKRLLNEAENLQHEFSLKELSAIAHTVKGSAAMLSITGISTIASKMEENAKNHDFENTIMYFKKLKKAFNHYINLAKQKLIHWNK